MARNYTVTETGEFVYEDTAPDLTAVPDTTNVGNEVATNVTDTSTSVSAEEARLKAEEDAAIAKLLADEEAFKKEQADLDAAAKAQLDAKIKADSDAFKKAQADIQSLVDAELLTLEKQKGEFVAQQNAAKAAAALVIKQTAEAKADMAEQMREDQRIAAEMAAKLKADMESMQRTSAAKIAGSRKAGRSASNRSILAGYGPTEDSMPTLGGGNGLGGFGGDLGITGTLGVGG